VRVHEAAGRTDQDPVQRARARPRQGPWTALQLQATGYIQYTEQSPVFFTPAKSVPCPLLAGTSDSYPLLAVHLYSYPQRMFYLITNSYSPFDLIPVHY
jgi:hypothetical protein